MQPILEALHEYYKAFSSLELNAIVSHFCEPCMSIGPQGVFSAANRAELASTFAPLVEDLRAKGYGKSEFAEPQVTMLSDTAALVQGSGRALSGRRTRDGAGSNQLSDVFEGHRMEDCRDGTSDLKIPGRTVLSSSSDPSLREGCPSSPDGVVSIKPTAPVRARS